MAAVKKIGRNVRQKAEILLSDETIVETE